MLPQAASRTSPRLSALGVLALLVLLALIALSRLDSFGIWDPWELSVAESARKVAAGGTGLATPLSHVVSVGFRLFKVREWSGRLPIAAAGVLLLLVTWRWARGLSSARVAAYAAAALGTTPFFLLHSRLMLGWAPTFLLGALVMLGAAQAVFGAPAAEARRDARARGAWLLLALTATAAGTAFSGALLTAAPPLLAVCAVWLALGSERRATCTPAQRWAAACCSLVGLALLGLIARDVLAHAAAPSPWIGAAPLDPAPPTYERAIEHLFHSFVPWSCVLPVALGSALALGDLGSSRAALQLLTVAWASFGYAAQTLFTSAYGSAPFVAAPALAVAAALWLEQQEAQRASRWAERLIVAMMIGLAIRDFALYPGSPLGGLELSTDKVPDIFNPKRVWAVLLVTFGGALTLLSAPSVAPVFAWRAPYRRLAEIWRLGRLQQFWLVALACVIAGTLALGAAAWLVPTRLRLNSLGIRISRGALFIPPALPLLMVLGQLAWRASAFFARARTLPTLAAALAVGVYSGHGFIDELSAHLSPRDVFDTFNKLAKPGEKLAQFKVEGKAGAYYAHGSVEDVPSRTALLTFLDHPDRRWAALPSEELADIDDAFRKQSGRHLFVPAAENARIALVATQAVASVPDQNPLTRFVLRTPPRVQHPVNASFDGKIELIGYDLALPAKDHVGPGQSFEVTWVFRALQSGIGTYKVFVHVDGQEQRLHGDHDPVDGKYPVRLWDEGDVIVDRQTLKVPSTYPEGQYTMYVGFFRGESRLQVAAGKADDANRVIAGTIELR